VSVFFALASPESVFMIVAGECPALVCDWTLVAQLPGTGFATGTGLRAFGFWREKEGGSSFARCEIGPMFRIFSCGCRDLNHSDFSE
jgi:hypothetical protein